MITALLLSVFLFLSAVASHLAILGVGHRLLDRRRDTQAKLAVSLIVLASHFLVAILFAAGFWLGAQWGLGGFDKAPSMDWMDYFYFSLINVTTLGLGDIYPTEHLRVLAGVEALTGRGADTGQQRGAQRRRAVGAAPRACPARRRGGSR